MTVRLIGHGLPVDFLRAFGRDYWEMLLLPETGEAGRVTVRSSKVIGLTGPVAEQFGAPVREIKGLFHGGSADAIGGSRFGPQTGQTHDGLLLNRSPTRLFHEAPGQFRDLDLSRCYPSVLREMNLYVGRPVVWEPGNDTLPLADVVGYLDEHAAAWDGWFVKVSGSVSGAPNVLIPSSHGALTHLNYHKRAAKQRAKAAQ